MDDVTVASWILLAVGSVGRTDHAALASVIGAADAINHAVLLRSELELAVQMLEGAGFVEASEAFVRLTDAGRGKLQLAKSRSWRPSDDLGPAPPA